MAMTDEERDAWETYKAWSEKFPLCEMCGERFDPDELHDCAAIEKLKGEVRYEGFYDYAHEHEHEQETGGMVREDRGQGG